jgi:hypothetical protein
MSNNNHSLFDVDAVITWVDGNDPAHEAKRANALNSSNDKISNKLSTGHLKTRFLDNGELYYCVASLRKYAPWIRNIYVVTDNQVPDFLTPEIQKKYHIHIVDHKEIFKSYEWALPTFNSMSIETAIWRIPDLSERFIYLNDDFILCSPVDRNDFFQNGNVVLRGEWRSMISYSPLRIKLNNLFSRFVKKFLGITRSLNLLTQIRSAKLANFKKRYFYSPHVPHPIQLKTIEDFYKHNSKIFEENIGYPFRSTDQHTIQYLANHLEIKKESANVIPPDDALMINGETDIKFTVNKKVERIKNGEIKFLSLQGFESLGEQSQKNIRELFNQMIPPIK